MDDLPGFEERAAHLREGSAGFLRGAGGVAPELRQLHVELARIEECLPALDEHMSDEGAEEKAGGGRRSITGAVAAVR